MILNTLPSQTPLGQKKAFQIPSVCPHAPVVKKTHTITVRHTGDGNAYTYNLLCFAPNRFALVDVYTNHVTIMESVAEMYEFFELLPMVEQITITKTDIPSPLR